jgi:hypothetical protein
MNEEEKESETPTSYHYVTDPEKCYKIQEKYGWKLLGYEEVGGDILKVKCIYEGETEFPSSFQKDD